MGLVRGRGHWRHAFKRFTLFLVALALSLCLLVITVAVGDEETTGQGPLLPHSAKGLCVVLGSIPISLCSDCSRQLAAAPTTDPLAFASSAALEAGSQDEYHSQSAETQSGSECRAPKWCERRCRGAPASPSHWAVPSVGATWPIL